MNYLGIAFDAAGAADAGAAGVVAGTAALVAPLAAAGALAGALVAGFAGKLLKTPTPAEVVGLELK